MGARYDAVVTELGEGHTVRRFDADMDNLRLLCVEMAGKVLTQVADAVNALCENDKYVALDVIEGDVAVDELLDRIDAESTRLLARRRGR